MLGRAAGDHYSRADKSSGVKSKRYYPLHGHHFLHTAIDGHSRLAYSELLTDQREGSAAAFWYALTRSSSNAASPCERYWLTTVPATGQQHSLMVWAYRTPTDQTIPATDKRQNA